MNNVLVLLLVILYITYTISFQLSLPLVRSLSLVRRNKKCNNHITILYSSVASNSNNNSNSNSDSGK